MPTSDGPFLITSTAEHTLTIDENGIANTISVKRATLAPFGVMNIPKLNKVYGQEAGNTESPNVNRYDAEDKTPKAKGTDTKKPANPKYWNQLSVTT